VVLLRRTGLGAPEILLVRRLRPPFQEEWALPGGFVDEGESPERAARRELQEETGLRVRELRQIGAFGEPGRDPRGWTVSVAFWGWTRGDEGTPRAADDAEELAWWPTDALPDLAFDHAQIVARALENREPVHDA
jgi:8-oxo-dGTP diphosphatase